MKTLGRVAAFLQKNAFEKASFIGIAGFAFDRTWMHLRLFNGVSSVDSSDLADSAHVYLFVSLLAFIICLLIVVAAFKSPDKRTLSKGVIIPSCIAVAAGTLLLVFPDSQNSTSIPFTMTSAVLTGAGSSFLLLGWGRIFADQGIRTAIRRMALAFIVSFACAFIAVSLPAIATNLIFVFLPFASGVLLRLCAMHRPPQTIIARRLPTEKAHMLLKRTLLGAMSFGFIAGCTDTLAGGHLFAIADSAGLAWLLGGLLATSLLFLLLRPAWGIILNSYRISFFLMALGCLMIPFMSDYEPYANVITFGGYTCFQITLIAVSIDASRHLQTAATKTIGLSYAFLLSGEVVGLALSHWLIASSLSDTYLNILAFGLTALSIFTYAFLFTEQGILEVEPAKEANADTSLFLTSEQTSAFLAEQYHLSPREAEILPFLIEGRTIARIQDEFSISKGTVSTHTRHIYQKINVQDRQELLDLIQKVRDTSTH